MSEKPNPQAIARAIAIETAEDSDSVGDFAGRLDLGDGVYDFRFEANLAGYEKWQWAVTLYHDEELDAWTVNESSLMPTDDALMPPKWISWRERLLPSDLSVTDSLGTDPDDERLEEGFRKTAAVSQDSQGTAPQTAETTGESDEDMAEVAEEYRLSRRRVLSRLGRSNVAQRWYDGPHGPKSLSTKTAGGLACETCGFFVPLQGELNMMFGVCANKWSPDDGRVVSLDHGCGEHSEIVPPAPEGLWPDRKPAYDDLHIDIVKQTPKEEADQVEALESADAEGTDVSEVDVESAEPVVLDKESAASETAASASHPEAEESAKTSE